MLRKECKLRVYDNRVLRKIFEPRREEVTGVWSKLHSDGLQDWNSSPNFIQVIKMKEVVRPRVTYEEEVICIQGFGEET